MSLKKWLHTASDKYFGYRSLLRKLAKEGKDDIITTDPETGIRLVTSLYLDADISFAIELPDGADSSEINENLKTKHLDLLSDKIAQIEHFFNQSVALAGFLGFIIPFLINYTPWLFDYEKLVDDIYCIVSSTVVTTGAVVFRKNVAPFIMKQIAGKLFTIRFKSVSLNKKALAGQG